MTKPGTHGKLVNSNSGVEIPGTFRERFPLADFEMIGFSVDGAGTSQNTFPTNKGWFFEADLPPIVLPKTSGSVVIRRGSMPFVRIGRDAWIMPMSGSGYNVTPEAPARSVLAKPILHDRLVYTDAEVSEYLSQDSARDFQVLESENE